MQAGSASWTRRELARAVAGAVTLGCVGGSAGAGTNLGSEESLLGEFSRSLTPSQRQTLVFPFDDPKRTMVQNHWAVVPQPIAALTADQQELALGLIRQVCTPEGFARLTQQRDDDAGGWKHDYLALFGSPAEPSRCQWVVTGRHLTIRGTAAGQVGSGPIFLGHSLTGPGNFWQEVAGLADRFQGRLNVASLVAAVNGPGLPMSGLRPAERAVILQLLTHWTGLFRAFEAPAVAACVDSETGIDSLVWEAFLADSKPFTSPLDAWRLSGPGFRWSFHARPHAHCWLELT